jgi:cytidylate kinase
MPEKPTTVLAISRQLGSGGSFVGHAVATRLGMRYADREILQRAAAELGLAAAELAHSEERTASFWDRLLRAFGTGPPDVIYTVPTLPAVYEEDLFRVESRIITELASRSDVVIVGRAGFSVLAGHPGLVSVMLHAARPWRVSRLMEVYGIGDAAEAARLAESSDRKRLDFIKAFAGVELTDATVFDLCLDTSTLGLDLVTDLVTEVVQARMRKLRETTA